MQRRAIAAARRGRERAKMLMIAECTIKRPTGNTYDPALGHEVATYTTIYTGKCGYEVDSTQPAEFVLAATEFTVTNALVKLPIGSGATQGDLVEITSSQLDLPRPGTKAKLIELAEGTHRTAERWRAVSV
ncbi:DUF6093 family protein [Glutamicibacter mysorens]|uniref:DUF6093 family protein n=1 Tax=Glutamicibacter mysorens TaxID=257984 RepID=UPI0020C5C85A|nr:DUF6093 family protein [Glutamicibacter mysorens]UTM48947.1 DUF6093 family protein [Glutamicibacter mysorens]